MGGGNPQQVQSVPDEYVPGVKFGPVEGFFNHRTCTGYKNNGACNKTINDGSGKKVFEVCQTTCKDSVEDPDDGGNSDSVDKYPPGVKFGPVQGFRSNRTCTAYKNNGACNKRIKDGSGQKVSDVCQKTCSASVVDDDDSGSGDKYPPGVKFGPVQGFRGKKTCTFYKNKGACNKNVNDGSGKKVFEVCSATCGNANAGDSVDDGDSDSGLVDTYVKGLKFGPVEGFFNHRTCTGYKNNGACNKTIDDGSGQKVSDVCQKTC